MSEASQDKSDSVTVQILDREYQFASNDDQKQRLIDAGRFLDRRMREIRDTGRVVGTERIAVMAALNLAYELLSGDESGDKPTDPARISQLVYRIEEVLESDNQLELT